MRRKVRRTKKRWNWLITLINTHGFTVGAEIGCARGMTTFRLLKFCKQLTLYAVDLWDKVPEKFGTGLNYLNWDFITVERDFLQFTASHNDRLIVLKGLSWEMAKRVKNASLDFVFIDAGHERESVKKDILAWTPKLKPDGILCGHDWDFPGVDEALTELIPNHVRTNMDHVWWCKKEDVK